MVDGIFLFQREAHVGVALKVLLMELSAPDHLLREGPLHIHEMSQHLIIGLAWEEDLAREEFIDHTADAPDVHGVICIQHQINSWPTTEAEHDLETAWLRLVKSS